MNTVIIVFWLGLSFFLIIVSYQEGLGHFHKPGPGLAPFIIGAMLLLFSTLHAYFKVAEKRLAKKTGHNISEENGKLNVTKTVMVFILLFFYGLLLNTLGFIITTFLLLSILFYGLGVKLIRAALYSLISVLACYFLFTYLGMRFPPGVLKLIGL